MIEQTGMSFHPLKNHDSKLLGRRTSLTYAFTAQPGEDPLTAHKSSFYLTRKCRAFATEVGN
jgi:hypothetical protein